MDFCEFKASLIYRVSTRTARAILRNPVLKNKTRGWRDGSEVKSTYCSSRGPKFNSQQPHGGLQPSKMRSGALFWCAGIHGMFYTQEINLKKRKKPNNNKIIDSSSTWRWSTFQNMDCLPIHVLYTCTLYNMQLYGFSQTEHVC